jgi:hypothetical protein
VANLVGLGGLLISEDEGTIIQGRYDVVCPPQTAWELHKAWPESRLFMIPDAGHGATVSVYQVHMCSCVVY